MSQGQLRRTIAAAFSVLAVVFVWGALVAPSQAQDLTVAAFLRVPIEGLVLIALAAVLPPILRRILAGLAGPALALLVVLKILDIAFFTFFARPFDIIGDAGDAGIGIETLRAALGRSEANMIVYGGVALAVVLLIGMTLAVFRLTASRPTSREGHSPSQPGSAPSGCSARSPAPSSSPTPRSPPRAPPLPRPRGRSGTGRHTRRERLRQSDQARPVPQHPGQPAADRFTWQGRPPRVRRVLRPGFGPGLLLLPAIDALLNKGTQQLRALDSPRSAFLNAPGFGGISWLAHSTLQSGVWANSQRRYDQLVASDRFTLSDAFNRAGWRTINFAPADDRSWPEGSSFYHYAKLYDRRAMGYRGPGFNYAPMPDQYMFGALQRLELARPHRPLFAEVDTVSSHMPWDRIPQMIPWNDLGNGSIFNRIPMNREPSSFWWHPNQVKAAYARSLEYSLNALISFVQHYGKKNLVLVAVGDEQPLAIVSGQHAGHDVPISIIAHDPSVLKRIGGWDWQSGLLPSPHAPVLRMSALRDRFLTAYGPQPATGSSP